MSYKEDMESRMEVKKNPSTLFKIKKYLDTADWSKSSTFHISFEISIDNIKSLDHFFIRIHRMTLWTSSPRKTDDRISKRICKSSFL